MSLMLLQARTKDYLWGGDALKQRWGKQAPGNIAESWEFSLYPGMESRVVSGAYAGMHLGELFRTQPQLFGEKVREFPIFPLLIKLLDARRDLSVQVHPSDLYALTHAASLGKSEVWYVAEAGPDAAVYCGFSRPTTAEEVRAALASGDLLPLLQRVPVKAGDAIFVRAGTVHAILAGVVVFEVQENSDLTYRLYDYDRVGADGQKRPLHVQQALEVARFTPAPPPDNQPWQPLQGGRVRTVASCRYFTVRAIEVQGELNLQQQDCFGTFTVLDGVLKSQEFTFHKGDTAMLPAHEGALLSGAGTLLYTTIE